MRGQGIAGHVAETGKILNIHCAYDHPLFYKGLDERTGFITRYNKHTFFFFLKKICDFYFSFSQKHFMFPNS